MQDYRKALKDSLAASLRFDGSVDRTQKHNLFVVVQIVKSDGNIETLCVGFDVPKEGRAPGYLNCIISIASRMLPWEEFFGIISSIVTDGESLNLGPLNGLVVRLQKLKNLSSSKVPLFSIWCVPHRTNLAWKSVSECNSVVRAITRARKLSKFFHGSGKRKKNLFAPSFFAVRWVECVFNLCNAVLRNWRAAIKYFESEHLEFQLSYWLQYDTLRIFCFIADVLGLLKTFQKACQGDKITLMDVTRFKETLLQHLKKCEEKHVAGGWEELLQHSIDQRGNSTFLHGIRLHSNTRTRAGRRRNGRFTETTRKFIIHRLIGQLDMRLELDDCLTKAMKPLNKIIVSTSREDLNLCHAAFATDLDPDTFISDYYGAALLLSHIDPCQTKTTIQCLQTIILLRPDDLKSIKIVLARVVAAKPHSADVERLISKCRLAIQTNYLSKFIL